MAISNLNSSRYTLTYVNRDGTSIAEATRKPLEKANSFVYTCREADTFYSIAGRHFGDETLFWKIADLNPHIKYPDTIPIGTQIRIPL